ncbi:DHA2 family efflux MFS transporter permease subunit [Nonomuraea aurantiaca]|uniref:DHA2 family efflux MFS transporter permease subunit n=1 Tax=Nonomuraea aurantiaca TaxID=2878562 RepID=UPI001CD9670F|nr:DHA2 family efflux MFS transporter permease subunit [Nonomuraea aurantiaca]MCA2228528.1 DHA2 family efflux MFS transporter permease subunit [Nonomuraea aurantiaca]
MGAREKSRWGTALRGLRGNPWAVMTTTCLGYFITILNSTSVSIAVPEIQTGLGASLSEVLWVVGGYVLALAVLTVTAGRLGDVAGPRNVFLAGMVVFAIASALCGFAQSPWQLIAARLLQGVGAALIIPQTLTMMTLVFPPERRGRASAVWGVTAGLAGVAGPTLGGLLVSTAGWRSVFAVNLPVGVLIVVLTLLVVPPGHARRARRLNAMGAALAGAGLGAITFGLLEGRNYGWGTVVSFVTVPMVIVVGCLLLAGFVIHQHRAREPLVPTRLFADRTFTLMTVSMAAVSMCVITLSLTMTLYLQTVLGMPAAQAGLTLAPWALGMTFGFPVTSRLVDRFGGERVLLGGLTVYAAALTAVGLLCRPGVGGHLLMVPLAVAGLSQSAAFGPITSLAMRDVGADLAGAASGVFNTIRQTGTLIGVSVLGTVLQARLNGGIGEAVRQAAGPLPAQYRGPFAEAVAGAAARGEGAAIVVPPGVPGETAERMRTLAEAAYGAAFGSAVRFTLLVCAASVVLAALGSYLNGRARAISAEPAPQPDASRSPSA